MSAPEIHISADQATLATAIADRLVSAINIANAAYGNASIVVTGGGIGTACLAAVRDIAAGTDWSSVHIWWGDERYVAADDQQRNCLDAREALLDHIGLLPQHIHEMPSTNSGLTVEAAARAYDAELRNYAALLGNGEYPRFDVLMLGVGPDGHVASLFPDHPGMSDDRAVLPVHGSPKPPPTRISMGMPLINTAYEVWLLASGDAKAPIIRLALDEDTGPALPSRAARGTVRTLAMLDADAASHLPRI